MASATEIQALLTKFLTNLDRLDDIVNGPAEGAGSTVETDNGDVPTFASLIAQALAQAEVSMETMKGVIGEFLDPEEDGEDVPAASIVTLGAGTHVLRNRTFDLTENRGTSSVFMVIEDGARIDCLNITIGAGVTSVDRGIQIGSNVVIGEIHVTATDQLAVGDANQDGFVRIRSVSDVTIGSVYIHKVYNPVLIENAKRVKIGQIQLTEYGKGVICQHSEDMFIGEIRARVAAAGASALPGHNSLTISNTRRFRCNYLLVEDSAEHGVYISGNETVMPAYLGGGATWPNENLSFGTIVARRTGQCAVKIKATSENGAAWMNRFITIDVLDVTAASYGSTPGSNEDGLRIEWAEFVSVGTLMLNQNANGVGNSCYDGVFINASRQIDIGRITGTAVAHHVVHITCDWGDCSTVRIGGINVTGIGSHAVYVNPGIRQIRGLSVHGFVGTVGGDVLHMVGSGNEAPSDCFFDLVAASVTGGAIAGGATNDPNVKKRVTVIGT